MPRPKKYQGLYGRQEVYRASPQGKEKIQQYEQSEARREQRRRRTEQSRLAKAEAKKQEFVSLYGDPAIALVHLNDDEKRVICLYYGLDSPPISLEAIGKQMGVSRQWVHQIKQKALEKIAHLM